MHRNDFGATLLNNLESLSIYSVVFKNNPGRTVHRLLSSLARPGDGLETPKLAARLFEDLVIRAENTHLPRVGGLWQDFILDQVIAAENTFTRMAAGGRTARNEPPAKAVKSAAAADLGMLKHFLDLDFSALLPSRNPHLELLHQVDEKNVPVPPAGGPQREIYNLKKTLISAPDWTETVELLAEFHRRCGYGPFCLYHAFRWDGRRKKLTGIPDPDPVRLEHLVGYDRERGLVVENTERLLAGLPAGNVLLYGDRGTGKSSTVKALIHQYGGRGLRMIELPKAFLGDFQEVLAALRGVALKFIIFVDDLSFEEHETGYKQFKSALEGSLQASPGNVAIYATSNRRHLLREFFEERRQEVHGSDTLQEKLSLSDRFGITVLFLSPDQELYLKIVEELARQKGIDMPVDELRLRALDWERWHNCRSGRTARQFVDYFVT
ncbi:MAG: ATP-binding protein [Peptococcaceae bacterium]|nr:ATP-binding protein [Peptococcaceae bacterium]